MCGRFYNHVQAMHDWVDVLKDWPANGECRYNVAPTQSVPVVTNLGTLTMRWGLIPNWSKEFASRFATFNARVEEAYKKPSYRGAWNRSQTCLVPAGGYYEWKTEAGKKQPYLVRSANGQEPLVFAGLWDNCQGHYSFTVLTEEAKGIAAEVHQRMPVMLTADAARSWLEHGSNSHSGVLSCAVYQTLTCFPVSMQVNNVRNEGEDLIKPV